MSSTISKMLLSVGAVVIRPNDLFTWASGIQSPIYCDNRLLLSHPLEREKIVKGFLSTIRKQNLEADLVAGTATAGIPWAAMIAQKLKKPMAYIRSSAKDHGKHNQIEGKIQSGQRVLVIEDLISTGGSSLGAVEAVRAAGGQVTACLALFTYGLSKASGAFEGAQCPLFALTNIQTLLRVAKKDGSLDTAGVKVVKKFLKSLE